MTSKFRTLGLVCLAFSSCMTLNDDWIDLGDNYTFHQDGKWKSIYPSQLYFNTKIYSQVVDYKFDDRFIVAKQTPDYEHHKIFVTEDFSNRFIIYSNFLKDSTSKSFVDETTPFIRERIKADSTLYRVLKTKGVTPRNLTEDKEKISLCLDSVFRTDQFYVRLFSSKNNFWIIDKDNNTRIGPLTKDEFQKECNERRVKLQLD